MAVARVERRPSRVGQFFSVALMFMLLKSTQESFGRAYRGHRGSAGDESPRGAHARGGVVPKGARLPGAHRGDARAALTVDTPWTRSSRDDDAGDPGADAARADADPDPSRVLLSNATSASLGAPANDDGTFVFPEDISGTFKGHWSMVTALGDDGTPNGTTTPNLPGMRAFLGEDGAGVAVLQLRAGWDPRKRSHWTRGEIALRDGSYITENDVHLRAEGMYVEPTGMVQMIAGNSRVDGTFGNRGGGDGGTSFGAGYREALRTAARDVVGVPFITAAGDDAAESSRPENIPGSPGLSQLQRVERLRSLDDAEPGTYPGRCSFTLRAWVTPGSFKPIDREAAIAEGYGDPDADPDGDDGDAGMGTGTGTGTGRERPRGDARRSAAETAARRRAAWSSRTAPPDRSRESLPGEGGGGAPTLTGMLRSEDCGFELKLTARWFDLGRYYRKATNYAVMIIASVPLQIYLLVKQTEHSGTQAGMAKVSLACVGMQAVLDSYQCLLHLTAGIIVESLFHSFSTAAFFQFALFSVFEMRVLLQIWKSRRPNAEQNWLEIRRDLSALYSRFYGGFLCGFFVMYWLQRWPWLIAVLCNSYWLPQIAWSAWNNSKKPLLPKYVLGISVTRLLVPLYLFGCPENFVRVKPQFWVCWLLVAWVAAQVAAIAAQHVLGPRCFVPKAWLPEVYDYHRQVDASVLAAAGGGDEERGEAGGVDCVICMAPVDCADAKERMVTPCNHFFHRECLERWMEVKMECPTCRGGLPIV